VRDLEAVAELAEQHRFARPLIEEMPANNLSLVFHRLAPKGQARLYLADATLTTKALHCFACG
jgi:hypothetical protein